MISDRNYHGQFITVRPNNERKLVIVVSKKISTKAVVRNKLRRQLKELLRQQGIKSGIVRVTRHPGDGSFDAFSKDIEQCLNPKP